METDFQETSLTPQASEACSFEAVKITVNSEASEMYRGQKSPEASKVDDAHDFVTTMEVSDGENQIASEGNAVVVDGSVPPNDMVSLDEDSEVILLFEIPERSLECLPILLGSFRYVKKPVLSAFYEESTCTDFFKVGTLRWTDLSCQKPIHFTGVI